MQAPAAVQKQATRRAAAQRRAAAAAALESVHRRLGGGLFGSGAQGSWIRSQVVSGRRTHALCFCARALCSGRVAGGPAALGAEPSGARAAHGLPTPALPARAGARRAGRAVGRVCRGRDLHGGAAGRGRAAPRPRWAPAPARRLGLCPGVCMRFAAHRRAVMLGRLR